MFNVSKKTLNKIKLILKKSECLDKQWYRYLILTETRQDLTTIKLLTVRAVFFTS